MSDTALPRNDAPELKLGWSRRLSIRQRILAVNIFAIVILAGSLFYLDGFRSRLTQARIDQAQSEAVMIGHMLAAAPREIWQPALIQLGRDSGTRLRVYSRDGAKHEDSWNGAPPTYELRDPSTEAWYRDVARALDNGFDAIVGARQPEPFTPPVVDRLPAWPEAVQALRSGAPVVENRRAPDGTAYVSAAVGIGRARENVLLLTVNARDVRRVVRAERLSLAIILFGTLVLSALLSRFLARTIANPLRALALAAHRVRLGRAREVDVPTLPSRRDEIGLLARALSDMTQTLRHRIDATEAFAADVTHELKNPLASLRSAVDSLERVEDPGLRRQLLDVVRHDVVRLDRLVVDIAESARLDAELSRARFEPVDLGRLIEAMVPTWEARAATRGVEIAFARPLAGTAVIMGDESRLARLVDNLVDNAISFSPEGGLVDVRAAAAGEEVLVSVDDEGPGVPTDSREAIFNRFHSIRPDEDFGRHSGLGLAIAKAIVEGHDARIEVRDRHDGRAGARFVVHFRGAAA
ncbi:ATP-binding protein [Sphingosinicella sp. LHD-64]|uniref:sensor histidine kinase n=1 Tax=Sphingosinicella sp. LHD-64 TaxID=3072139 RepID=UPI00280E66AF|nr:ATP-binding protein [Sphingosinicella sp. LHD-64]MDQ8755020.1 ATP-binding protein [Sphingosinicella sp. LHD-64]